MDSALRPAGQPPVPLSALVSGLGLTGDTGSRSLVTGITLDSRAVEPGDEGSAPARKRRRRRRKPSGGGEGASSPATPAAE